MIFPTILDRQPSAQLKWESIGRNGCLSCYWAVAPEGHYTLLPSNMSVSYWEVEFKPRVASSDPIFLGRARTVEDAKRVVESRRRFIETGDNTWLR
jgi:hypothetical protein